MLGLEILAGLAIAGFILHKLPLKSFKASVNAKLVKAELEMEFRDGPAQAVVETVGVREVQPQLPAEPERPASGSG